jgi:8-oxo-dGTP pyrophosphatase MutT (NUDIX family)
VAIVLRTGASGLETLLMTRAEHALDPWSGHVSLPGGRQGPLDADLFATALRETAEETGLDLASQSVLVCALAPVRARARGRELDLDVSPFVFRACGELEPRPGPEARELFWLPLARAARGELDGEHRVEHGGLVRRFPCWSFGPRVVWGLTRWILCELLVAAGLSATDVRREPRAGELR